MISAFVLVAVAVVVLLMSQSLGLYQNGRMGPGLWPFLIGATLLVSALGMAFSRPDDAPGDRPQFLLRPFVLAVGILVGFPVLLAASGVFTATAVAALVWLKFIAEETWRLSVITAVVLGAVIYALFIQVLEVQLPVDAFLPR